MPIIILNQIGCKVASSDLTAFFYAYKYLGGNASHDDTTMSKYHKIKPLSSDRLGLFLSALN